MKNQFSLQLIKINYESEHMKNIRKKFVVYIALLSIPFVNQSIQAKQPNSVAEFINQISSITAKAIIQEAYIKASNTGGGDRFGFSVALSGNTLIVGASSEDSNSTGINNDGDNNLAFGSGAVYVFVRENGLWSQQAYIKASNAQFGDQFGVSVDISGDTIVVGARFEDSAGVGVNADESNNSAANSGAAYVFHRVGTIWSQQAYLKASNTDLGDEFGESVAISNNTIVVGSPKESSNATEINGDDSDNSSVRSGASYIFTRSGSVWSQQAYLKASNAQASDSFGTAVSISNDTVAVGAIDEDSSAININGDETDNTASKSGATYVFVRDAFDEWSQQAYIKAHNTDSDDQFGFSLAIDDDILVVGANFESSNETGVNAPGNDNSALNAGSAYVYSRIGVTWGFDAYLKASNTDAGDEFGLSVDISGNQIVVGAYVESSASNGVDGDQSNNNALLSGAGYLFKFDGTQWQQESYLKAFNTDSGDLFGYDVAISGDSIIIGAQGESGSATGINPIDDNLAGGSGAVYVYIDDSIFADDFE